MPSIDTGGTDRSFVSHIKSIYAYYIHGIYAIHSLKLSCMHIRGCQIIVGVNLLILDPSLYQKQSQFSEPKAKKKKRKEKKKKNVIFQVCEFSIFFLAKTLGIGPWVIRIN